eukprot:10814718-Lingulodinium_polyedra.AAC.1
MQLLEPAALGGGANGEEGKRRARPAVEPHVLGKGVLGRPRGGVKPDQLGGGGRVAAAAFAVM